MAEEKEDSTKWDAGALISRAETVVRMLKGEGYKPNEAFYILCIGLVYYHRVQGRDKPDEALYAAVDRSLRIIMPQITVTEVR